MTVSSCRCHHISWGLRRVRLLGRRRHHCRDPDTEVSRPDRWQLFPLISARCSPRTYLTCNAPPSGFFCTAARRSTMPKLMMKLSIRKLSFQRQKSPEAQAPSRAKYAVEVVHPSRIAVPRPASRTKGVLSRLP